MFRTYIVIAFYLSALAVSIRFGPGSQAGSSGTGGAYENTIQSSTRQIHDQCLGVKIVPARNINAAPPEPNRSGANRAPQPGSNAIIPEPVYGQLEPNTGEPPVPPNTPMKREPVPPPNGAAPLPATEINQPDTQVHHHSSLEQNCSVIVNPVVGMHVLQKWSWIIVLVGILLARH